MGIWENCIKEVDSYNTEKGCFPKCQFLRSLYYTGREWSEKFVYVSIITEIIIIGPKLSCLQICTKKGFFLNVYSTKGNELLKFYEVIDSEGIAQILKVGWFFWKPQILAIFNTSVGFVTILQKRGYFWNNIFCENRFKTVKNRPNFPFLKTQFLKICADFFSEKTPFNFSNHLPSGWFPIEIET